MTARNQRYSPKMAHRPTSTKTCSSPMLLSDKLESMRAATMYIKENTMKTFCEMARRRLAGSNWVSDGFADRTTVTAPTIAMIMPKTSL